MANDRETRELHKTTIELSVRLTVELVKMIVIRERPLKRSDLDQGYKRKTVETEIVKF